MLRSRFSDDLKHALKNHERDRTGTLRLILAALKSKDIDARGKGNSDGIAEGDILSMLQQMVKQRRESVVLYIQGNRPELAAKEELEIAIIQGYLPETLEGPALTAVITDAITATEATSSKDMGKVMAHLKAKYAGQIDFSTLAPLIKAQLGV